MCVHVCACVWGAGAGEWCVRVESCSQHRFCGLPHYIRYAITTAPTFLQSTTDEPSTTAPPADVQNDASRKAAADDCAKAQADAGAEKGKGKKGKASKAADKDCGPTAQHKMTEGKGPNGAHAKAKKA